MTTIYLVDDHELFLSGVRAELSERFEVAGSSFAVAQAGENVEHASRSDAAGRASPARLVLGEFQEVSRYVDHAVCLVEHHQSARAHHGAHSGQSFEVHGGVA
jgi:hypothetical protein